MASNAWIADCNRIAAEKRRWESMTEAQREALLKKNAERDIDATCDLCGNCWADHRPTSRIKNQRPVITCPPDRTDPTRDLEEWLEQIGAAQ